MSATAVTDFLGVRDRLLHIARRIAGSTGDAEDIVQDAWLRWSRTDRASVHNPPAYLSLTATRLSISATRTARVRHQSAAGLRPDELTAGTAPDPAVLAEQVDDLRGAMRLIVERLTPRERVAFILREAFDYPYRQIGDVVGLSEANARQLCRRARIRVGTGHRRPTAPAEHLLLLGAFLEASRAGDPAALAQTAHHTT
jgi:RNA polymerase sigma factor (sigma-70 family)